MTHRLHWPRAWAALALACLSAAPPAPAGEPTTRPAAEAVMAELRSAAEARKALLAAEQEWAFRKAELELLRSTVLREAQRHRSNAAAAREQGEALKRRLQDHQRRQDRLQAVEAAVDSLCERLEKALATLAARCLPGVVPADRSAGVTDPSRRLAGAVERVNEAQRRTKHCTVEVVGGTLHGRKTAVRLLRMGGAAAWWVGLDGSAVGAAAMRDGQLVLTAATQQADIDAIREAFEVAEGRTTPRWVLLPMPKPAGKE